MCLLSVGCTPDESRSVAQGSRRFVSVVTTLSHPAVGQGSSHTSRDHCGRYTQPLGRAYRSKAVEAGFLPIYICSIPTSVTSFCTSIFVLPSTTLFIPHCYIFAASIDSMVQFGVWLTLFATGTSSAQHQVDSVSISNRNTPITSKDAHTHLMAPLVQPTTDNVGTTNVEEIKLLSIRAITTTTSVPRSRDDDASHSGHSTAGADAVRAAVSSREWISTILDTAVMALLSLASIVVAIILGRKQLRAMRVQLQIMLDTVHRYPGVEMNDLERGQHDPDGDRIEVRSGISSVNPAHWADPSNDLIGVLPEPQPHVVGDDIVAQPVRNYEQASNQPRQLPSEHDSPHAGAAQREEGGQPPEDSPTASTCSQSGRQDSKTLNPNDLRHLDDSELKFPTHSGIGKSLTLSYQV